MNPKQVTLTYGKKLIRNDRVINLSSSNHEFGHAIQVFEERQEGLNKNLN